jgi:tetratricopeptide (TPR) repeat protein
MWPVIVKILGSILESVGLWATLTGTYYTLRSTIFKRSDSKQKALRTLFNRTAREAALVAFVITVFFVGIRIWLDGKHKREEKIAVASVIEYRRQHRIPNIPDDESKDSNWPQDFQEKIIALERFEKAGIPLYPESRFELGRFYSAQSKYLEAIEELGMAVRLRPDYVEAHQLLSISYLRTNQLNLALDQSEQVRKLANNDDRLLGLALDVQGAAYRRQGKLDESLSSLTQCLSICEGKDSKLEAVVRDVLGLIYLAKKKERTENFLIAKGFFEKALSLHRSANDADGEATTLRNFGLYYLIGEENNDSAIDSFEQALAIANREHIYDLKEELLGNIGIAYYNKRMMDKAEEYYQKEFEIPDAVFPPIDQATALSNIGNVHQFRGDFRGSLSFYLRALQIYATTDDWDFVSPNLISKKGLNEKTTESVRINVLKSISYSYFKLSELDNAISFTKQLLEFDPHNSTALYNLPCFYSLRNDKELALDWLRKGRPWFTDQNIEESKKDSDFDNIRSDPRFKQIMSGQK